MYCLERGPVDDRRPIAVVAALHGDEPCGAYAIADLLATDPAFQRRVKFVVANERAMEAGERYVDDDLNRAFPGDPHSRSHERRLAARLREELADAEVITFHSTDAEPTPFALLQNPSETTDAVVRATGLEQIVDISYVDGGLEDVVDGVAVECGPMRTRGAAESARGILERFLTARGALPGAVEPVDLDVYRVDGVVDRGDLAFTGRNFQRVHAGDAFAVDTTGDDGEITAPEPFTPVLMATDGYDDMLGFQATNVGPLSELEP
ncbi:succinylglutamate desuccinylase/aspartoacylase domain-containing protein [Halorubellus litoreus]|uniref:Succinylglutamate desuccinylase/aspartoacylase family protein n=1 Tax=Halorubellus litoreus TaxID=755308 RepID=A0ABD5VPM8_9EURY